MLRITLIIGFLCFVSCSETADNSTSISDSPSARVQISSQEIAASINDNHISLENVRELISAMDGGLPVEEAVQALIRNELLAAESKRRGYGQFREVADVRKRALARSFLRNKIGEGINPETLDQKKLRQYYESKKEYFVHGPQRRVVHILATLNKKKTNKKEALKIAEAIAERARKVKSEEEFISLGEAKKKELPKKIIFEHLDPFSAESKRLVKPFVEGAFAVSKVGQTSPPVETGFGWHVIYVAEELPEKNVSFEEARIDLAEKVLPYEREARAKELLEQLHKSGSVFIYEDVVQTGFTEQ
ncbi:MAG: peptidyl-prolyl cis-trans isomerase [Deltaproteobacteria bacterium]|nr:peptidyl-prolyl cis-trans isomerase [Deltaproteobacteria bacterium]